MAQELISIGVSGVDSFKKFAKELSSILDNDRVADEAGAILLDRIRKRFLDETDPDGRKWPKSKAAQRRKRQGKGGGTLYDTGTLWRSIQLFSRGTGIRAIGTDVPYAKKHQYGLDGMEKRVFLGFSDDDVDLVEALIQKRIADARRRLK